MTTDPTPSPRPAALVEAMANAVLETASFADATCLVNPKSVVIEAIRAAADMGFVLIPRAELEGVLDWIKIECDHLVAEGHPKQTAALEMVEVLRQMSRG